MLIWRLFLRSFWRGNPGISGFLIFLEVIKLSLLKVEMGRKMKPASKTSFSWALWRNTDLTIDRMTIGRLYHWPNDNRPTLSLAEWQLADLTNDRIGVLSDWSTFDVILLSRCKSVMDDFPSEVAGFEPFKAHLFFSLQYGHNFRGRLTNWELTRAIRVEQKIQVPSSTDSRRV